VVDANAVEPPAQAPALDAPPRKASAVEEYVADARRLLREPNVVRLIVANVIVQLAVSMTSVALPLMVLTRFGVDLQSGIAVGVRFVPNILFGPFVGQLVGAWNPKWVMVWTSLASAAIVVCYPLAGAIWQVQLLSVLGGLVATFAYPAFMALRPRIIPPGTELSGNAVLVASERIPRLVGPLLAVPFISLGGIAWLFRFEAVATVIAAGLLIALPRIETAAAPAIARSSNVLLRWLVSPLANARELLRLIREDPVVWALTVTGFTYVFGLGLGQFFLAAYSLGYYPRVSGGFGYFASALAIGAAAGGIVTPLVARGKAGSVYVLGNVAEAACWVLLPLIALMPAAIAVVVCAGVFEAIATVVFFAEIQLRIPAAHLPRYWAVLNPFIDACLAAGIACGGVVLGRAGLPLSAAAIALVIAGPILLLLRPLLAANQPRALPAGT
jgi:MFS family permease